MDEAQIDPAIAPDGSPVAIFAALPPTDDPALIHAAVAEGGSILELGCGAGRMTRTLVELGHRVLGVDESPEMLRHVREAEDMLIETVLADIFTLHLDRTFDGVVCASHFINQPEPDERLALLDVCRRHVRDDGVVLLERYEPGWARAPHDGYGQVGPVEIEIEIHAQRGPVFEATATYRLGPDTWAQRFTASAVEDDQLEAEARSCGLVLDRWLDARRTWALLRPTTRN